MRALSILLLAALVVIALVMTAMVVSGSPGRDYEAPLLLFFLLPAIGLLPIPVILWTLAGAAPGVRRFRPPAMIALGAGAAIAGWLLLDPVNKGHIEGIVIVNFIPIPMAALPYALFVIGAILVFLGLRGLPERRT
jgi:hypothetical protein